MTYRLECDSCRWRTEAASMDEAIRLRDIHEEDDADDGKEHNVWLLRDPIGDPA